MKIVDVFDGNQLHAQPVKYNLRSRLIKAEARVEELEKLYFVEAG